MCIRDRIRGDLERRGVLEPRAEGPGNRDVPGVDEGRPLGAPAEGAGPSVDDDGSGELFTGGEDEGKEIPQGPEHGDSRWFRPLGMDGWWAISHREPRRRLYVPEVRADDSLHTPNVKRLSRRRWTYLTPAAGFVDALRPPQTGHPRDRVTH